MTPPPDSSNGYATSSDGLTYTLVEEAAAYRSVAFGNGVLVAHRPGRRRDKTDGTSAPQTTTVAVEQTVSAYGGIVFGNGQFLACGKNETAAPYGACATSSDGLHWTVVTNGTTANIPWGSLTWANDLYVGVSNSSIVTSTDGATWQVKSYDYSGEGAGGLDPSFWADRRRLSHATRNSG